MGSGLYSTDTATADMMWRAEGHEIQHGLEASIRLSSKAHAGFGNVCTVLTIPQIQCKMLVSGPGISPPRSIWHPGPESNEGVIHRGVRR